MSKIQFLAGLDLGQVNDYSGLVIAERLGYNKEDYIYHVRSISRFALGTSYVDVMAQTKDKLDRIPLRNKTLLVLDYTGVGRSFLDFAQKSGLNPIGISITAGQEAVKDGYHWKTPKSALKSTHRILLEMSRLKISPKLPLADKLIQETLDDTQRITQAGNLTYSELRTGSNDDLLLSLEILLWYGQNGNVPDVRFRWIN